MPIRLFYITSMAPKHLAFATLFFTAFAYSGDNTITYGGQTYKTVKIGEQTWMAQNLNYEAEGSKCYDDNPDNCEKYGRLYDWETAMKVCPKGWHIPSNDDWDELFRYVDAENDGEGSSGSPTAGKHLKAVDGWNPYDGIENLDTHGFSALPGGYGHSDGYFSDADLYGFWWSASEYDSNYAYGRGMYYGHEGAYWGRLNKSYLLSVRCVKD